MEGAGQRNPPEEVLVFLSQPEAEEFFGNLIKTYGLPEQALVEIASLTELVVYGFLPLSELPGKIAAIGLDEAQSQKCAIDIAIHRLYPISPWFGDVGKQLSEWGVPEVKWRDVPFIPISVGKSEEAIKLFVEMNAGFLNGDEILSHRLELAIIAYLKNVRDRLETIQLLKRQVKVGGLGMDDALAGKFLDSVDLFQEEKKLIFVSAVVQQTTHKEQVVEDTVQTLRNEQKTIREDEPENPMEFPIGFLNATPAEQVPAGLETVVEPSERSFVSPALSVIPRPPVIQSEAKDLAAEVAGAAAVHDEIAAEVAQIAEVKKEIVGAPSVNAEAGDVAKNVLFHARVTLSDAEASKRFVAAVDARLRDVRGAFETRAIIEAPLDQNGVGITGMALANVMEGLEAAVTVRQRAAAGRIAQERDLQRQQKQVDEKGAAAHEQRETSVMNKRYAEITGQTPTEHMEPVSSPGTRASVAVPAADQLASRDQQIDTHKVLQAIRDTKAPMAPVPVTPVLSAASIPASQGRPKVQDIRFERKLAGPLEELRQLGLVDFRRLSKDPLQAATKIHDLVNLISDQGYDRKIAAIQAWRESPVSQQYVHLSQEALLTGKSIYDILRDRHANGEDTFTEAELRVVIDLNTTLRF